MLDLKKRIKTKPAIRFALECVKHPRELGTFTQSSKTLSKKVASEVVGKNIVELGAGTGPITKKILETLPEDGDLVAFEVNKRLCKYLNKIKDKRLKIVCDSAENFENYIKKSPDCIISGMPLTALKKERKHKILERCSKADKFVQYKYFGSGKLLRKYFKHVRRKRVLKNFPPAVVYVCWND